MCVCVCVCVCACACVRACACVHFLVQIINNEYKHVCVDVKMRVLQYLCGFVLLSPKIFGVHYSY